MSILSLINPLRTQSSESPSRRRGLSSMSDEIRKHLIDALQAVEEIEAFIQIKDILGT